MEQWKYKMVVWLFSAGVMIYGLFPIMTEIVAEEEKFTIEWREGSQMPRPVGGAAIGWINGKLICAGGSYWEGGRKYYSSTVYTYYPETNSWEKIADLPTSISGCVGVTMNNTMYVIGGENGKVACRECYALRIVEGKYQWQQIAPLPEPRVFAGGAVINDTIYVVAGANHREGEILPSGAGALVSTLFSYNISHPEKGWQILTELPGRGRCTLATAACNGLLYIFGGAYTDKDGNLSNLSDAYQYTPRENSWKRISDTPYVAKAWTAVSSNHRYIFIFGGYARISEKTNKYDTPYKFVPNVLVYDTITDSYQETTAMPHAVIDSQVIFDKDMFYLAGGEDKPRGRAPWTMIGILRTERHETRFLDNK